MDKFTSVIERVLLPVADKLSNNKSLRAIGAGFQSLLPVTMIGAIFALLANLQIDFYQDAIKAIHLNEIFAFAPTVTTSMLAVYAVMFIAYAMTNELGNKKSALITGGLALFVFLLLIPQGTIAVAVQSKEMVTIPTVLEIRFLGAAGLFSAIIIGLIVPAMYVWIVKRGLVIKLPDGVPPAISNSFNALIPGFILAFGFSLVRYGFSLSSYGSFNQMIYTVFQQPLMNLGSSPFAFLTLVFFCSFFWFFGIHGGQITAPLLTAIYLPLTIQNLEAFQKGVPADQLPNMITQGCWMIYANLGGGGGTLGLCIIMFFFAKSVRFKTLGRLSLPASLCGINEPITFGLPVVLNPIIIVPFVITPIITFTIAYICTSVGLVPPLNGVQIAIGTPVVLSAWLASGLKVVVLQIVLVCVQMVIYYPLFKTLDNKAHREEVDGAKEKELGIE